MKSATRAVAVVLVSVGLALLGGSAHAQDQDQNEPVTVVSHVDVKPDFATPNAVEDSEKLLRAEIAASLQDKGVVSYVVLEQVGLPNHFTIVETWRDTRAYQMHEGSAHTVKFREGLQPYLGSPFDTRVHHVFR